MTRKLWVIATVTLFGVSAALAGIGLTQNASACDEATKTAAATTSSCCAKDGAKSASADAKKVHNSMIKSAVFAPGAAPIMNAAAFGGMLANTNHANCDWCPEMTTAAVNASQGACATQMSAAACASTMSAEECAAMKASGACTGASMTKTASYETAPAGAIAPASAGHPGCNSSMATVASSEGCAAKTASAKVASSEGCAAKTASATVASSGGYSATPASVTLAAGGDGCTDKSASAASAHGKAGCCDSNKTASATGSGEKCASAQSASLKGKVDEMPYRESKKVVLAGSYACGHCTLQKTEDCSPMLKTADGKVYPLLQNNHAMEMRSKEGKNLEVSGTVKKVDGIKFLEVKSFKVM
jgi:hypothetical protein